MELGIGKVESLIDSFQGVLVQGYDAMGACSRSVQTDSGILEGSMEEGISVLGWDSSWRDACYDCVCARHLLNVMC
jgi:hypothetical protein